MSDKVIEVITSTSSPPALPAMYTYYAPLRRTRKKKAKIYEWKELQQMPLYIEYHPNAHHLETWLASYHNIGELTQARTSFIQLFTLLTPMSESTEQASDPFEEAIQFYKSHKEVFIPQYEGQWIAMIGKQVVDSDRDIGTLAQRVYRTFGYRKIFMTKVTREPRIYRAPSPRLTWHR